jgi:hypothetical protein
LKKPKNRAGGVAQVVKHMSSKCEGSEFKAQYSQKIKINKERKSEVEEQFMCIPV